MYADAKDRLHEKLKTLIAEWHLYLTQSYNMHTILPCLGYALQSLQGCCAPPLFWQEFSYTKVNRLLACGLFLLYLVRALMVDPYADNSKLYYLSTLS